MTPPELASLTLFRATPAQVYESRKRTWPTWGGLLTEEQYLAREARLDGMAHAVNSRMQTWVLAPRDDPETLNFMCACTSGAVASVFTPPHKRGKGYASHMMRLLHWVISGQMSKYNLPQFPDEWGAPLPEVAEARDGLFSILYSDIGKSFYHQTGLGVEKAGGWEVREPNSTFWTIPQEVAGAWEGSTDSEWTWLEYEDLDTFWEKDVQLIRHTMENLPESSPNYHSERPKAFVSCLPAEGVGSFHVFRSTYAAGSIVSMDVWGVQKKTNDLDPDQPTYATWSVDVSRLPPTLIVTRINTTESGFPELLRQIQTIARRSSIGKMEIWNLPKHLHTAVAETGGRTAERTTSLPSIKWYGVGKTEDVEWILNENASKGQTPTGMSSNLNVGSIMHSISDFKAPTYIGTVRMVQVNGGCVVLV